MQDIIELQIGKWGNSLGVRLPKHILESLHLEAKDRLSCSLKDGKLILKPVAPRKKYTLQELLYQIEEPNEEVSWGKPEGKEIW